MAQRCKKYRGFSAREARALLWLLPVLAIVSWLVWEVARPKHNGDIENAAITIANDAATEVAETAALAQIQPGNTTTHETANNQSAPTLFAFDPNTAEYHDFTKLGFTRGEALGIVKYRSRGKIFEIPEDFAACYQVSEEMYRRLKPYIRIGEKYRLQPFQNLHKRSNRTTTNPANELDSPHWQDGPATATGTAIFPAARHQKSDGTSYSSLNFQLSTPIELNSADSATLVSISGIGEKTVRAIMDYRAGLGGFVRVGQLAEVRGVTEQNYERIVRQIFIDTLAVKKIDINFAAPKRLSTHPYIGPEALRKLLKQRQLKGGWRTAGELKEENIFTSEELDKLRPYLVFN